MNRILSMIRTLVLCILPLAVLAQEADDSIATAPTPPNPQVKLETTHGEILLELFADRAPITVANFIQYVEDGFYDGTVFHRVIPTFMIQGGGYTPDFKIKETREPVINEADNQISNRRGTIAMARRLDPNSANAQFFINVVDNVALNHTAKNSSQAWGYAVFGQVIDGMSTVEAIRTVETGSMGPFRSDAPLESVMIERATVAGAVSPEPAQPESTDEG